MTRDKHTFLSHPITFLRKSKTDRISVFWLTVHRLISTMACHCSKKAAKITLLISVLILILSVAMVFVFGKIYNNVLKKEITLENGTLVTNIWKDIPIPIYERLYFFNITNSKSFTDGTQPLNVSEVGPYTYKSSWVKNNPQWHANNTVSYREVRTYHFVPEMSVGSEEDFIHTLNGPLIIAAYKAKNLPGIILRLLSFYLKRKEENLVTVKSVKELVYSGYSDPIISWASDFIKDLPYKDGKFSWLYGKNATDDGLFTVFTGADDATKTNYINNWNGMEQLHYWNGSTCNTLNATSIETGPPIHGYQESYTFFQSLICRSLTFNYASDQKHFGIFSKRFKSTYELFANSSENPNNHCFNVREEHPSGVLDLSPCQFGAPVYMSFPHFYFSDPSYFDSVNGLNPIEEKHGSHVDVEPVTGFSIDISIRVQINLEIEKISQISELSKVKQSIYPVFWIEIAAEIDENLANFLKRKVKMPKIIAYSLIGILGTVSLLLIVMSVKILCESETEYDTEQLVSANKDKGSHKISSDSKTCSSYTNDNKVNLESNNELINSHGTDDTLPDYYKTEGTPPDYSKAAMQNATATTITG